MAIDMWSFGCILAELYTGYPLFPGENEVEQLACIMEIFGLPSQSLLGEAQRRKLFFGKLNHSFPGFNCSPLACFQRWHTIICFVLHVCADSKGNPRCITNSKGRKRRPGTKDLPAAVKTTDAQFLDFLCRCLEWDPSRRMTPEEALQHEWILEVSQPHAFHVM